MHTIALAITPNLARLAVARTHPFAVAELLEAFFPHLPERIGIDIALIGSGAVSEVFHSVGLIQQIGVFQHILVTVEEVNTDTHVEDKVGEVELVLNIASHIGGSVGRSIAVFGVARVEEILQTPVAAVELLTSMVITIVVDKSGAVIEQLVGREHIHTTSLDIIFRQVAVDVEILNL